MATETIANAPAAAAKGGDLGRRAIGAAVGVPLVVAAVMAPPWGMAALMTAAAAMAGHELGRLLETGAGRSGPAVPALAAAGAGMTCLTVASLAGTPWLLVGLMGLAVATLLGTFALCREAVADVLPAALGAILIAGLPLGCVALLRADPHGIGWVCLALASTWLGDTGAYAVGRLVGRTPMAPKLSPKKTVEGAIGGAGVAMIAAAVVAWLLVPGLLPWQAALLGGLANGVGQVGDLFESAIKRRAGAKDSGTAIYGYGGALDKTDSLLFAAPLLLAAQVALG